jgi:hypothetical protein
VPSKGRSTYWFPRDLWVSPFGADSFLLVSVHALMLGCGDGLLAGGRRPLCTASTTRLNDNPTDKYGRHEYDASQFGTTDDALQARFAAYRQQFAPLLHCDPGL